jgi:putative acyl-CoA dehydrogenase
MPSPTEPVTNVASELVDYNVYTTDPVLRAAVAREGATWRDEALRAYGERLGAMATIRDAEAANRVTPTLRLFDRGGRRLDAVEFHPGWHALMRMYREEGLVAMPFTETRLGRFVAFAAGFFMHGQIESGSQCPATMTQASIPVLANEPALFASLEAKLLSSEYDPRDLPIAQKRAIYVGMGMTEKQGGSDVRSNTTRATPVAREGRGETYTLDGHKWFFSAPMCDAHLVLARTDESGAPSCFFVPRFRDDGTKNAVQIQRLKEKLGNRSNSSSEVEFHGAHGVMVGEPGRGIPTIIEMATLTRLHCVIGSAGQIRQALSLALHHTRERAAFGRQLVDQPLMRTVLADLALESEAATLLAMRLASSFEAAEDDPVARAWRRIVTPAAKFWVCKRGVELAGEAMEIWGGNGYVEDGPMARLFRDMPVNSIWEGSGNVMCLDVLRAIARDREGADALFHDLAERCVKDARLTSEIAALTAALRLPPDEQEAHARRFVQRLVLVAQSALMAEAASTQAYEAFVESRFDAHWGRVFGVLPRGCDAGHLIERAWA